VQLTPECRCTEKVKYCYKRDHPSNKAYTNKIDSHDVTEILLKVALNIITLSSWMAFNGK
jgi:hypothetical protein